MAQNRKSQSAGMRIGPVLLVMLIILLVGGGGVGFVWQKNEIHAMSQKKLQKEKRLAALRIENKQYRDSIEKLLVPEKLDAKSREFKLGLVPCPLEQVVRLVEPVDVSSSTTNTGTGLLARRSTPKLEFH